MFVIVSKELLSRAVLFYLPANEPEVKDASFMLKNLEEIFFQMQIAIQLHLFKDIFLYTSLLNLESQ